MFLALLWWPVNPVWACNNLTGILIIAGVIFSLIMLIDCLKRKPSEFYHPLTKDGEYDKLIWAIGILISFSMYFIGAIAYFFVVKKARPSSSE